MNKNNNSNFDQELGESFSRSQLSSYQTSEEQQLDEYSDVFSDVKEMEEDVFSMAGPSNVRARRVAKRRDNNETTRKSVTDLSDDQLIDELDGSPPASIGSRGSTSTVPGSRTSTPLMDQTLSSAFRDKIRNRLQHAKQRVKKVSLQDEMKERLALEVNEEIESRLNAKSDWRKNISKILDSDDPFEQLKEKEVTREEAYDFFTKTDWEPEQEEISPKKKIETSKRGESAAEEEVIQVEPEDPRVKVKDVFDTTDKWTVYETCPTIYKTWNSKDCPLLYFPSASSVVFNGSVNQDEQIIAKDDGLYVQKSAPSFSNHNRNTDKIKQRIVREGTAAVYLDDRGEFIENIDPPYMMVRPGLRLSKEDSNLLTMHPSCTLDESFTQKADYQLKIKLTSIKFTNHYLFNEECTLARKLVEQFEIYDGMVKEDVISIISKKLHSLQMTFSNLSSGNYSDDAEADKVERLNMYKNLLYSAYNERNEKIVKLRETLINMLSTWSELQKIRNIQGFISTEVRLVCDEEKNVNLNVEKQIWNELVGEALQLEKFLYKQNDDKAMEEYRKNLRNWKQWQRSKRRSSNKNENEEEYDDNSDDRKAPEKPEPPKKMFDELETTERIRKNTLLLDGRLPGEPKFSQIMIEMSERITTNKEMPKNELKRKNDLSKKKYHAKCFTNDRLVCQSIEKEANSNFVVNWNQLFDIKIANSRVKIRIQISEHSGMSVNDIAQIYLPLPDAMTIANNVKPIKMEFTHENKSSKLSGILEVSLYWDVDEKNVINCPPDMTYKSINNEEFLKKVRSFDSDQLQQWMQQLSLQDPNDPNNVLLMDAANRQKEYLKENESFPLVDRLLREFATDEEIENNPRFRILQLRSQGDAQFKGYRFVPLNEKEIPLDIFGPKSKLETPLKGKRGLEAKREEAAKILGKVREQLVRQSQGTFDRPRTLEDMVIEEDIPSIGSLGFTLLTAAHNKRPLNPYRKERKKITSNLVANSEIGIVITIMHALNVPVRAAENQTTQRKLSFGEIDNFVECKVCPFVEIVFQRESARTNTAEGPKPTWNETLSLKFRPPRNDCSPSNLTKISDCIYLNLFDEVIVDSKDGIVDEEQGVRMERRWLGSLKMPFATLYLNSKIEGTFILNSPPVLLGYEYDSKGWLLGGHAAGHNGSDTSKHTYLTLFVTIDPSLQLPEELAIKCDTIESESLSLYAKKWESDLTEKHPKRNIKALAIDLNAKSVLVCRYLRPLKPPEELLTNLSAIDEVMQRLARFISLIPSVPDAIALPGICDIWCNCEQFLDMFTGDEEEHAILLCNYFLYLGKRAAIVLGQGIPEGFTAYVIVWEFTGQEPNLWNATSGEKYSVRDSYIPLNSVGCIITPENIFANISKQDHPNRLNYDIGKTSNWKPLFTKSFPNQGFGTVQPDSLDYGMIDQDYALQLQENLEKHLRESLMRWRKRSRTFFNRHCIQSIRKILPRLERKVGRLHQSDLITDLSDILVVHKMTGFPLNLPFTDFNSITEAVYATGVHLAEDKKVEFALAVYVHPYPCNVLSVWVYIAALTRHN